MLGMRESEEILMKITVTKGEIKVRSLYQFVMVILWIFGIIIANGFWSTFFAVIVPLWSWYLGIEFLVTKYHIL